MLFLPLATPFHPVLSYDQRMADTYCSTIFLRHNAASSVTIDGEYIPTSVTPKILHVKDVLILPPPGENKLVNTSNEATLGMYL